MNKVIDFMKSFLNDEDGATATEYAVMVALIIVVSIAAIGALGEKVSSTFDDIQTAMP